MRSTAEEHGPLDRAGGSGDGGQLGHRGGRRQGPGATRADRRRAGQAETSGQGAYVYGRRLHVISNMLCSRERSVHFTK